MQERFRQEITWKMMVTEVCRTTQNQPLGPGQCISYPEQFVVLFVCFNTGFLCVTQSVDQTHRHLPASASQVSYVLGLKISATTALATKQ